MCWEAWAACRLRQPKRKKRWPMVGPLSMSTEGARPTKSCVAGAIPGGVVGSSPPTSSYVTYGSSAQGHGGMRSTATRCWRCAVPNITGHSIGCLRAINNDCGQRKNHRMLPDLRATARQIVMGYRLRWAVELFHKSVKQHLGFEDVATDGFDAVISHVHWVYCADILLHMSPPRLSPGAQSIGDKQRALQQGLADREKRHILQQLTQIGGVQRYKDELRQALAGI